MVKHWFLDSTLDNWGVVFTILGDETNFIIIALFFSKTVVLSKRTVQKTKSNNELCFQNQCIDGAKLTQLFDTLLPWLTSRCENEKHDAIISEIQD